MPDRNYTLVYRSDDGQFLSGTARVEQALQRLDATADRVKLKLTGVASGAVPSMSGAEKAASDLASNMSHLEARADAARVALAEAGTAAAGAANGLNSIHVSGGNAGMSLDLLAGKALLLAAVHKGIEAISQALSESAKYAKEVADKYGDILNASRELASIQGKAAPDEKTVSGQLSRAIASGMSVKESGVFETIWESTVPSAKEKGMWKLNEADTEDLKKQVAIFTERNQIAARTFGEIAPAIGISEPITSVQQYMGKLGLIQEMIAEGVGNVTPIYKVMQRLRGAMVRPEGGGAARSAEELAAIVSVGTVDVGNEAATTQAVDQAWRVLQKEKVEKKLGITPGMDFVDRIRKTSEFLARRPEGQGELQALHTAGMNLDSANKKIIQWVQELPLLEARTARVGRGRPASEAEEVFDRYSKDVLVKNQEFLRLPLGERLKSKSRTESVEAIIGQRNLESQTYLTNVEAEMRLSGDLDTPASKSSENLWGMVPFSGGPEEVRRRRIMKRAVERLDAEAMRVGVTRKAADDIFFSQSGLENAIGTPLNDIESFRVYYGRISKEIGQRGGETSGSTGAVESAVQQLVPVPRPPAAQPHVAPPGGVGNAGNVGGPRASIDNSPLKEAAAALIAAAGHIKGAGGRGPAGRPGGPDVNLDDPGDGPYGYRV